MIYLYCDYVGGLLSDGQVVYLNVWLFVYFNELVVFVENFDVVCLFDVYLVIEIVDGDVLLGGLCVWELFGYMLGYVGFWIGDCLVLVGDILYSYVF